jgi:uncharacterized membrane protein SpoIIM required for sporulation
MKELNFIDSVLFLLTLLHFQYIIKKQMEKDMEDKKYEGFIMAIMALLISGFITPFIFMLHGAIMGAVADTFFHDFLMSMSQGSFLEGHSIVEIGAFLGFLGGSFKSSN